MAININQQIDDTFYRYQMSELETRQEGKGNGKSTKITNLLDVSPHSFLSFSCLRIEIFF